MDLPTYTNIWRIEKRLYKLYDLRLPTPLPIVWIGVFVGVAVPWSLLLALLGVPFHTPWHVLYLVPPGVVTWLATRPVIEGKRLTELLQSQTRYLGEPKSWCRMTPAAEPETVHFTGRVWRALPVQGRHAGVPAWERLVRPVVAEAAAAAAEAPVVPATLVPVPARMPGKAPALGVPAQLKVSPANPRIRQADATAASALTSSPARIQSPLQARPPAEAQSQSPLQARPPAATQSQSPAQAQASGPAPAVPGAGREPVERRPAASGRAIDNEALRRLRKLAASAEAEPSPPAAGPAQAQGRPPTAEEDQARLQHRRGQPSPRLFPPPAALDGEHLDRQNGTGSPAAGPSSNGTGSRVAGSPSSTRRPADQEAGDARRGVEAEPPASTPHPASEIPPPALRPPPLGEPWPVSAEAFPGEPPASSPRAAEGRVRRVESVVGRETSGGWRRLAQVVVGNPNVRGDGSEADEARARAVFPGSRRIVVLGCTGGAGQSTTALMLGQTLASIRDDRVLAIDASTGAATLTSRIIEESPETLTSFLAGLGTVNGYLSMRAFTTRTPSGLEVLAADSAVGAEQRLADRTLFSDSRLGQAMRVTETHYKLTVADPAPALAARVLAYADQLVLVVPANGDGAEAVAMTYDWLDGHGRAQARRRAVLVVNGVSRRSMDAVEQAEAMASGRCRAIVRVPWEDELAAENGEPVALEQLRTAGRRAYLALAGVVVAGFATATAAQQASESPSGREPASDPPGTRIGER